VFQHGHSHLASAFATVGCTTQAPPLRLVLPATILASVARVLPIALAQLVSPQGRSPLVSASATLGLYDPGTSTSTCIVCDYTCLNCTGAANSTCTACDATRTLTSGQCPCSVGLYDSGVAACSTCDYTCLHCSGSISTCTDCVATRTLTSSTCPCNGGLYDPGASTCLACDYTCLNCTAAANTTCTACVGTRTLTSG
jgi:hypothetical protein